MKIKTKEEVKNFIENLEGFDGYVQISNREFEREKDLFINKKIKIYDDEGFVVEGFFCNGEKSIMISFLNGEWVVGEYDIKGLKKEVFLSKLKDENLKIKLAHIFEEREEVISDIDCENKETIKTLQLKTVVFAGFEGVKNESTL